MFTFVFICVCFLLNALAEPTTVKNATVSGCGEVGDCISHAKCNNKCGCGTATAVLFYNETLDECVVSVKKLLETLQERYNIQEKIHMNVEKVFEGVIFSAILFASCAALCAFTACVYCCRINYTDMRLKNDVEALASKLKRDCRFKKTIKQPAPPGSENCNIIVEEAGVFVV